MRTKIHYVPIIILIILIIGLMYVSTYSLKTVRINGCIYSSADKVEETIRESAPVGNTLLLYLRMKIGDLEDIPFVAKLDIEFEDKNTVIIEVYEKSVAGCLEYMEHYVYFDKDGMVLETADERYDGVPQIKGLTISRWEIGEKLPIENQKKFDLILNITQLIDKYELSIQGIEFTADGEVILRHDNIEIELGDGSNVPIQLMNLGSILEEVEGMNGILYMKEYNTENPTVSFKVR